MQKEAATHSSCRNSPEHLVLNPTAFSRRVWQTRPTVRIARGERGAANAADAGRQTKPRPLYFFD